ncbi:MAG TPA: hypothetical protein VNH11_24015 [Pirellulales bacterium]|nr:hypothetical protein [Pirellulales bacterium]
MFAEIRLCHARRNIAAARSWYDLWQRMVPDGPQLDAARELLEDRSTRWMKRMWDAAWRRGG